MKIDLPNIIISQDSIQKSDCFNSTCIKGLAGENENDNTMDDSANNPEQQSGYAAHLIPLPLVQAWIPKEKFTLI